MALSISGNRLVRQYDHETLWVEPWGPDSLRIRLTAKAQMPSEDWALLPPEAAPCAIHLGDHNDATVTCGNLTLWVDKNGGLTFSNAAGQRLFRERWRLRGGQQVDFYSALGQVGHELRPIPGGDYHLTWRLDAYEDERLYGMGQYQDGCLDLKGCMLELAQRNSQASVPFCLSSRGYGVLWNNPAVGRVTFGRNFTEWVAEDTEALDVWVTAGDTPAEILEAYTAATGRPPMMPEYAMGFWQCKLRYETQEQLLSVAREYHRRGLPLNIIVADFFHWTRQGEWKFDPKDWPDPEAMVAELKGMGVELMVSIWPTVDMRSENYAEMLEKGYLTRTDRGVRTHMLMCGNQVFIDPTNPEARDYVWNKAKQNYYEKGIRLFWLDEAEPEYNFYDYDNYRYALGPDLKVGNFYPVCYARTFYDGMAAEGQEHILNLVRCAWAGSQRYGALVWSGDVGTTFETLRIQLAAGLNMGLAGIPWWTTDIGGFSGGDIGSPSYRELLVRWFQFGCLCPAFRLHGDRLRPDKSIGLEKLSSLTSDTVASGGPNEVWSYGEEVYDILVSYMALRERLRPYIRSLMQAAHALGAPVIRPLFYDFPDDPAAWAIEDEYCFGPDLLVAPILYEGQRERAVYLPAGATWTDAWRGQTYEGGQTVTVPAPLAEIPLFLRDGASLPIRADA